MVASTQKRHVRRDLSIQRGRYWIPACAGMTSF